MAKVYSNDFKIMIVELLESGQTAKDIGEEYAIHDSIIRRWKREYKEKLGDFSKKKELTSDQQELTRLKKELADIKMERDILKKAVSIFSKSDR